MNPLNHMGFHGTTDKRAARLCAAVAYGGVSYCEHVVTGRCNFKCPYCNVLDSSDDPSTQEVYDIIDRLAGLGCQFYHITGGEPTVRDDLMLIVQRACERFPVVRLSTNGSADPDLYRGIVRAGCTSFAVSLDTDKAGVRQPAFERVVESIRAMVEANADVQVGVVFDKANLADAGRIIRFVAGLGVQDIKVGTASQELAAAVDLSGVADLFGGHNILSYRAERFRAGRGMRGLRNGDSPRCYLALDDVTIKGGLHYPCAVYLREGGIAVGRVGPDMMRDRESWFKWHNSLNDPICCKFCMDFKCDFNNAVHEDRKRRGL